MATLTTKCNCCEIVKYSSSPYYFVRKGGSRIGYFSSFESAIDFAKNQTIKMVTLKDYLINR